MRSVQVPLERTGPAAALDQLRTQGHVTLPGRMSDAYEKLHRRRRRILPIALGVAGLGLAMIIAVVALGRFELMIFTLVGGFLIVFSIILALIGVLSVQLTKDRVRAASEPVTLDETGIRLRGIGPIPWLDVAPPQIQRIWTKNDIHGWCAVMPLTRSGWERVNRTPGMPAALIGPRPYLHLFVPYLLVPGIEGFSQEETVELFRFAHEHFTH